MSKFIPTQAGLFRVVRCDRHNEFLFRCPVCGEWLPMDEETLAGKSPVDHVRAGTCGRDSPLRQSCSFSGKRELGKALVTALQVRRLMDEELYLTVDDEAAAERQMHDLYGGQR